MSGDEKPGTPRVIDVDPGIGSWSSVPYDDDGDGEYVQLSSHTIGPSPVEIHQIREATDDDPPCCRCGERIAPGKTAHTVTVTQPDGSVSYRQATCLRHLGG